VRVALGAVELPELEGLHLLFGPEFQPAPAQILNVRTLEKQSTETLLGVAIPELIDISWPFRTGYDGGSSLVEGPAGSWTIPQMTQRYAWSRGLPTRYRYLPLIPTPSLLH
jgi:hypothetical protein